MWNLRDSGLIVVIFDLKLDGPNLNNLEFEGLCRSEAFRMAPMSEHASILSECQSVDCERPVGGGGLGLSWLTRKHWELSRSSLLVSGASTF